jgi:biopolymer transport protein ExbD
MWEAAGLHRAATDKRFDQVILHVDNAVPYKLLVAVIDAINAPRRSVQVGRRDERVPALNVNLAAD